MDTAVSDIKNEAGAGTVIALGAGSRGLRGQVIEVGAGKPASGPAGESDFSVELERRLLEMGFVEGARVEILHEGFIGHDPIAVLVDDMRVAIRRKEANAVLVRLDQPVENAGQTGNQS
jgi:ferrous iron transport protein A